MKAYITTAQPVLVEGRALWRVSFESLVTGDDLRKLSSSSVLHEVEIEVKNRE